jgi:hypothetical protein
MLVHGFSKISAARAAACMQLQQLLMLFHAVAAIKSVTRNITNRIREKRQAAAITWTVLKNESKRQDIAATLPFE